MILPIRNISSLNLGLDIASVTPPTRTPRRLPAGKGRRAGSGADPRPWAGSGQVLEVGAPSKSRQGQRRACTDCDILMHRARLSQTTASQGGDYLLPHGVSGPSAFIDDVSSTLFDDARWHRFAWDQSRGFATWSGRHRIDLHRLPDGAPKSGPAGDGIPGVARRVLNISSASFLPGWLSFLPVDCPVGARPTSFLGGFPGRLLWTVSRD